MTSCSPEPDFGAPHMLEREAERNRALRRADWRFLLSAARPTLTACCADGSLRDAVRYVSQTVAPPGAVRPGACDLVVATDPSDEALRKAFELLEPGGSCYVEYRGWARASAVRDRLRACGFEDVRTYWAWPSPERCLAWIPLDGAVLRAYFGRGAEGATTIRSRLRPAVRRVGAVVRRRLGATRVSAVGTRPGDRRGNAGLIAFIRQWWSEHHGGSPPRLHLALQVTGTRSISKVLALVYAEGQAAPILAVKIARTSEAAAGLANEAAALQGFAATHGMPSGLPRFLFQWRDGDVFAVGETALPGVPRADVRSLARYGRAATAATEWLVQLAAATRSADGGWAQVTARALERFEDAWDTAADRELLAAVRLKLAGARPLPAVCEHRDFSPWNVHIGADAVRSVFDWESSQRCGVPALDAIYFLTYLSLAHRSLRGQRLSRQSYRAAWDRHTPVGQMNHACLDRYAAAVGVEAGDLPALRLLTWVVHAPSELARIAADTGGRASADVGLRSTFLDLIREEAARGQQR